MRQAIDTSAKLPFKTNAIYYALWVIVSQNRLFQAEKIMYVTENSLRNRYVSKTNLANPTAEW